MTIDDLMIAAGEKEYYSDGFKINLEDHIGLLKSASNATLLYLEKDLVYKYQFDLFGYLLNKNIPNKYHWVIMRCNGLTSPQDSISDLDTLILPDFQTIEKIKQTYTTLSRIR